MAKPGHAARRAALTLMSGVRVEGLSLAEQLGTDVLDDLSPADRARAQRLATETFRNRARADRLIDTHIKRRPSDPVRDILRLAIVELCVDRAAPHGVVDGAVTLTRASRKHSGSAGMVNAVLRKIAEVAPDEWSDMPVPRLPAPIRKRFRAGYGNAVAAMEAAHHAGAPLDLTVNEDAAGWAEKLGAELLPTGSLRLRDPGQVSALPGFAEGAWWVQDAAAALPVKLLDPHPGQRIADLCAAPGGKTLQLAAAGAEVLAVELSEPRLRRVSENLKRTELKAEVIAADALTWQPDAPLDAVVLDAPCSATGTIRRHPDLPFLKSLDRMDSLLGLQAQMIDHALSLLKPGGKLLYCTCSLLPIEGERQVKSALERHGDATLVDLTGHPLLAPEWVTDAGTLRLRPDYWPERGGMDGFFAAILVRT